MTTETEMAHVVEMIAENLGIASERIFEIFVNAQTTIGIIHIVSIFVVCIVALLAAMYTRKWCKKAFTDDDGECSYDDEGLAIFLPILAAFLTSLVIGVMMNEIGDTIIMIMCPEYSAMKEIIELVIP